jgi:hypothetical protein
VEARISAALEQAGCSAHIDPPVLRCRALTQAVCLLSTKVRGLLCGTQYLQLLIARACEVPSCLPPAMNALLALLQVHFVCV